MGDDGEMKADGPSGPVYGPIYDLWESTLEKLKVLNYDKEFCNKGRMPFHRVHFVYPGSNSGVQFEEFVDLASWLCDRCGNDSAFERDQYDDPNTIVNNLLMTLRGLGYTSSFAPQKLKMAHGEPTCEVLSFLADKALENRKFHWGTPQYVNDPADDGGDDNGDGINEDDNEDKDDDEVEDDIMGGGVDEDNLYQPDMGRVESVDMSLDNSHYQVLEGGVDPIEWKTEVERVAPRLRVSANLGANEWRAHVDQTVSSKGSIDKILGETQSNLHIVNKTVGEEIQRAQTKEKYMNHQFNHLATTFGEHKRSLEELEKSREGTNEKVSKLTNELAELADKLDDIKENFESKDSGMHDQSPLVKMKAALQQIKTESYAFDLRIGVVSHSLLAARIAQGNRRRAHNAQKIKARHAKKKGGASRNTQQHGDEGYISD
jgi:intraflagellar transport protein 57